MPSPRPAPPTRRRRCGGPRPTSGAHLFNALYQLDVERLNEEIEQVRAWLPVTSFLVIDKERRVLTDGTGANARYGEAFSGPLPEDGPARRSC